MNDNFTESVNLCDLLHRNYRKYVYSWNKDMKKHYGDKRRVIKRRFYQLTSVIFLNTGKPTREQIKEKLFSSEFYLITDEEAFLRHLFRKWMKDG